MDFGGGRLEAGLEGALNIIDGASGCDDDQDEDRDDGKSAAISSNCENEANFYSRVKCVSLTVVPDYIEEQPSPPSVSVTSLLTSLSLAHLAPRLLLNGFDTVPRLQNLSTGDLNFLEVKEDRIMWSTESQITLRP